MRMKTVGPGGRGFRFGCIRISWGRRLPFLRLQGAQEATMFSQTDSPPRLRGMTWSTVRRRLVGTAVLAGPTVAGEYCLASDAPAVDVARDPHEADQADHLGTVEPHGLRAEHVVAVREDLRLLLEEQDERAPDRADVQWLVARVQDQHPPAGQAAGCGYRYLGVGISVLGGVVAVLMGGLMAVDRNPLCGGPVAHIPRDCSGGPTRLRAPRAGPRSASCPAHARFRPWNGAPRSRPKAGPRRRLRRRHRRTGSGRVRAAGAATRSGSG